MHSRRKHIDIRHHFIRGHVQRGDVALEFISSDFQIINIFAKPLDENQFSFMRREWVMLNPLDKSLLS